MIRPFTFSTSSAVVAVVVMGFLSVGEAVASPISVHDWSRSVESGFVAQRKRAPVGALFFEVRDD